eukprot:c2536_g1_i1.p1 GENE.c2536_g1_i1~~c2536_g1_i1.p1  ORF type:complete len:395 (-),score=96.80 c2536_g1_i1:187-1335(-)
MGSKGAEFLNQLKLAHPSLSEHLDVMLDYYNRKLWHQLTDEIEKFILGAQFSGPGSLSVFYNEFIKEFAFRLNKLRLAQIARRVSENFQDLGEARAFTEGILNILKDSPEAVLYTRTRLASIALAAGQVKEAKDILIQVREAVDDMTNADPVVHSALAKAAMDFHRSQGTATEYYRNALSFLTYTPAEKLTPQESAAVAFELGLAACVGDDIYNFGELLVHPAIRSLESSDNPWLLQLLVAFDTGSIPNYQAVTSAHAATLQNQTALVANKHILDEKIRICALLELVFHRPAADRVLTFAQVAAASQQPVEQVEFIVMRAMSLGLLRGIVDEVDHTVHISWIKPRVLQQQQLEVLKDRLGTWSNKTQETLKYLEGHTTELIA